MIHIHVPHVRHMFWERHWPRCSPGVIAKNGYYCDDASTGGLCIREFLPNSKMPANCETGLVQSHVELQVLLSALILPYKIKKKLSKEIQLHEWNTQPLLTDKAITRVKGQTCVKLLSKKLLGSFSLIQREVGIWSYSYIFYTMYSWA